MVSVQSKSPTERSATARALVQVSQEVMALFTGQELHVAKGPVFQTAIIAGIQGAKKTGELIPLCHPIGMDHCQVDIRIVNDLIEVICTAQVFAKTGVEMEALTGATVAALTIYDMCKAYGQEIEIREVVLLAKQGGKKNYQRS